MNANETTPTTNNVRLKRLQKGSFYLRNIFFVSAIVFGVIGLLGFWLSNIAGIYPPISFLSDLWALGDALECWFAYKLFAHYVNGDWFAPKAVRWMRWIGILSLIRGSWNIWNNLHVRLYDRLYDHIHGSPFMVQIIIYAQMIFSQLLHNLVFGCVIIFIAWIMDEGRKIQEEQELTV